MRSAPYFPPFTALMSCAGCSISTLRRGVDRTRRSTGRECTTARSSREKKWEMNEVLQGFSPHTRYVHLSSSDRRFSAYLCCSPLMRCADYVTACWAWQRGPFPAKTWCAPSLKTGQGYEVMLYASIIMITPRSPRPPPRPLFACCLVRIFTRIKHQVTVVVSVDQPRPEIWRLFSHSVLLKSGRAVLCGRADQALQEVARSESAFCRTIFSCLFGPPSNDIRPSFAA